MRCLAFAVTVMALLGSCTKRDAGIGIGIGVVVGVSGGVAASGHESSYGTALMGSAVVAIGAAIVVGALIGGAIGQPEDTAAKTEDTRHANPAEEARRRARDQARSRAWELTKQAAAAARAGDCTIAVAREREVREVDAEFHATVFLRDAAIQRCLDAARAAAPQPSASP